MKLAYATTYDAERIVGGVNEWSGLGYYIAESLKQQSLSLNYIGPLKNRLTLGVVRKAKRHYYETFHQKNYIKDTEPLILQDIARQVTRKLKDSKSDFVFSATITSIAYLDCQQPIAFWADATFENTLDFYPQYSNLCKESVRNGHLMEQLAIQGSKLAIYSSDWAAQSAINYYNADPDQVKVVPFGANIDNHLMLEDIKDLVDARPADVCKLLFLGIDWHRKGGDVAYKVAKGLNAAGLKTELTVVGCQPEIDEPLPEFVKPLGYIAKSTAEGQEKIIRLLAESHFLILPSRAECYGVVFCEANSLGLPCLSTNVGGIPTIIRDGINGKSFNLNAEISEYCTYIIDLFANYSTYKQLALSAFNEYKVRLNWTIAGKTVKELLMNAR